MRRKKNRRSIPYVKEVQVSEEATPFVWQGNDLATIGDLMDAMSQIMRINDVEERQRTATVFMDEYRAVNPHANANIGYLAGYFGHSEMVEALRLFGTSHPVFGGPALADKVTMEGAFESGKALGERMKQEARN